jgi:hypothetical protein
MTIQQLQQYPLGEKGLFFKTRYGVLKCNRIKESNNQWSIGYSDKRGIDYNLFIDKIVPVLYPLSCLTQEIEVYGERFVPMYRIGIYDPSRIDYLIEQIHTGMVEHIIITMLQSWFINYQGIEAVNPFDLEINPYK